MAIVHTIVNKKKNENGIFNVLVIIVHPFILFIHRLQF